MNCQLIKEVIALVEKFDATIDSESYDKESTGFKRWTYDAEKQANNPFSDIGWEGKENS